VTQGSVLGPILFLLYTAHLLRLMESNHLHPHLYADDTQIYAVCHPTGTTKLLEQMSACIDDVAMWMRSNRLQLNTAKTEVILCWSGRRQDQIPQVALRVAMTPSCQHHQCVTCRYLHRLRRISEDAYFQNRVQLLRRTASDPQH